MLLLAITLTVLAVTGSHAQSVTMSCTSAPSYIFTVSGGTTGGKVYAPGLCGAKTIASDPETFTFAIADCTTLPVLDSTFTFVVQSDALINQASDYTITASCTRDLQPVTKSTSATVSIEATEGSTTSSIGPATVTLSLTDNSDSALSSGLVGASAKLVMEITDSEEKSQFDFKWSDVKASITTGEETQLVTTDCAVYAAVFPQPTLPTSDKLEVAFSLFRLIGTTTDASSTVVVTFTVEATICAEGSCTLSGCGARKRRSVNEVNTNNGTLARGSVSQSVVVYPPELARYFKNTDSERDVENVCVDRVPMIGIMVGLAVALIICMAVVSWMFCRMRSAEDKSAVAFTNNAYKA